MNFDVIIIGGGAAGLFCALQAGRRGRKTLVIEHNGQVGRKILISGGGRCNFTNLDVSANNFISQNSHFCKSALARYRPQDFIELVKSHQIQFYEKKLGQLFCRESARQIVDMLLKECGRTKVEVRVNCTVRKVSRNAEFRLETTQGEFTAQRLVIASGGLSFPKVGATGFGYKIARQFGIEIVKTRPSLVPLIIAGQNFATLAGVSIDSLVKSGKREFRENILFTHRGLSGPAILQISNYWQEGKSISINLLPETNAAEMLEDQQQGRQRLANFLGRFLPNRFAESLIAGDKPLYQIGKKERAQIAERLNNWQVFFTDTEGYDRAEVTLGGVSTSELSSQTLESKKVPGLYFIGEVVDVTGWLGGYNFQWAWSSGYAAGQSV
jgi:predicted Rossmann fold flavoprotein